MTLTQIRHFATVARSKSLRNAACQLYVSQSALSKQIKALETELGFPLLYRDATGISLTAAGQTFLESADRILAEYDLAMSKLDAFDPSTRKRIRLATIPVLVAYDFAKSLAAFELKNPGVCIEAHEDSTANVTRLLDLHQADLAIMRTDILPSDTHMHVPLLRDELVLAVSSTHRMATMRSVSIDSLATERFVLLEGSDALQAPFVDACQRRGIALKVVHRYARHELLFAAVAAGMGVTVVPEYASRTLKPAGISLIHLQEPAYAHFGVVWPKDHNLTPSAEQLIRYLECEYHSPISDPAR